MEYVIDFRSNAVLCPRSNKAFPHSCSATSLVSSSTWLFSHLVLCCIVTSRKPYVKNTMKNVNLIYDFDKQYHYVLSLPFALERTVANTRRASSPCLQPATHKNLVLRSVSIRFLILFFELLHGYVLSR